MENLSTVMTQEATDSTIVLADGKVYRLSELHLNAQAALEGRYQIKILAAYDAGGNEVHDPKPGDGSRAGLSVLLEDKIKNVSDWQFLAYQLMRKYHRNLTEEEVGYLITPSHLVPLTRLIMTRLTDSLPIPDETKNAFRLVLQEATASAGNTF